ncbi:hypothetical protein CDIK_4020 [Cucumispora dikerogammari]|nr:hypothetical protein CDIK_4020 [Cucumispora dikerogammari]
MSIRGAQFYQYGPGLHDYENDNILIFFTSSSVSDLLAKPCWCVDGTFKTTPIIFYQLFSISYIKNHHVFPCIFVLLSNKTQITYVKMWRHLSRLIPEMNPSTIISDFEKASLNVIKTYFPDTRIQGCFFHLTKNVFSKVCDSGLKRMYNTDPVFKKQIKLLTALAYLEVNEIREVFHQLYFSEELLFESIIIYDYFYETYIGDNITQRNRPRYPIELWRLRFADDLVTPRTNNAVESWHNAFKGNFSNINNSFYKFVSILRREEENIFIKRVRVESGERLPISRKYSRLNEIIINIIRVKGEVSLITFINNLTDIIVLDH